MNTVNILGDQQTADLIASRAITEFSDDNLQTVGMYAFYKCENLTSISAQNVKTIGPSAFYGCKSLSSIDFPSLTTIESSYAFGGCASLSSIDNSSIKTIGTHAFDGCRGLRTINMPNADVISNSAFYDCTNLKTVNIPNVTRIETQAFSGCTGLGSILLPNLKYIGIQPFMSTTIEKIVIGTSETETVCMYTGGTDYPRLSLPTGCVVYVSAKTIDKYRALYAWSDCHLETIDSGVTLLSRTGSANRYGGTCYYEFDSTEDVVTGEKSNVQSVVFSNNSYVSGLNITGTHVSFLLTNMNESGAEENFTISITLENGNSYTETVNMRFNGHIDPFSFRIEDVPDSYQFVLSDGVYENTNQKRDNTVCYCKVVFSTELGRIIFDVTQSSESQYDFGMISKLDTTLTVDTTVPGGSMLAKSFAGVNGSRTVEIDVPDTEEHFVTIKYKKDSSQYSGTDTFTFLPRFE